MGYIDRAVLNLALRHDLATFIHRTFQTVAPGQTFHPGWHIRAIAWHLEQAADGNIKRLLITLPPRHLKSISTSVAFVAWLLGRDPSRRIICASYGADLAAKFTRDCRAVIESPWYQSVFPGTRLSRDKNTEMEFTTTRGGYRYSTSVGGPATGRGGNTFILDDMLKAEDALSDLRRSAVNDWFDSTLYSRLDDKRNDVIILTMQRLHLDDLVGHVLRREPWVHLNLPAIAEEEHRVQIGPDKFHVRRVGDLLDAAREPLDVLKRLKAGMTSFQFSAQYQQRPIPLEGEIIKWEWFPRYDQAPLREARDQVVQSWDTASKADEINDYSVCITFLVKGDEFFVLDVLRERLNFPDLKRRVTEQALRFGADAILIEDKGSGTSLIQELFRERPPGVVKPIAIMPEGDKVSRMGAASFRIESKQVYLPRRADWLEEFRNELLQFPFGSYDDQVDSLSQFLNWFNQRRRGILRQIQI